jgi:hypothetical protein
MDAMDRMDDDGSPEPEEIHAAAAEDVEQATGAQSHPSEPRLDQPVPPHVEAAPVAPAEPAPAPPATPDHADPDPQ